MFPVFIVTLHNSVTNKRIRGLSPYKRFYPAVVLFTVYKYYLIFLALRREDQSVLPPGICLLAQLCSHLSVSELWALCRVKTDLDWSRLTDVYDTYAAGKNKYGQTGLFCIISDFSKVTIVDGAEAA